MATENPSASSGAGTRVFPVADGVLGIDLLFQGYPHIVASYVLQGPGGRFALVECGPERTLHHLKAGLAEAGLALEGLEAVLVTHIHLDHAGAAGALARQTGCAVYVHEVGLPHLADPSRLWASAARIFGPDMERLWQGITPVPQAQLRAVTDGMAVSLFGRTLQAYHTPGHASHHVAYRLDGDTLFTGDAAGVRMPGVRHVRGPAMPPEFHLEQWDATIERIRELGPRRLVLTHFGSFSGDGEWHLGALRRSLHDLALEALEAMRAGLDDEAAWERLGRRELRQMEAEGTSPEALDAYELAVSLRYMVSGFQRYWQRVHPERLA